MVESEFGVHRMENMDPSCLVTTVQAGGGGVMMWLSANWASFKCYGTLKGGQTEY